MSAEMQKQMKELTKPENIAALAAGITALGVAHAYGIGQIVDGVLLAQFGVENTTKLLQFVVGAVTAKRGSDLQLAAKNFSDVAMNTGALLATAGLMKGSATVVKAIAAQLPKLAEIAPKTAVILSGSIGAAKLGLERSSKNLNSALVKFGNSIGSEAVTKIGQLANGTKEVLHETNQVFDKEIGRASCRERV